MRILCVDDDADVLDLTVRFLEQQLSAATIHSATRIEEATEFLETEPVDCIVSDYDMPERTGLEFLKEVRARDPDVPFILFTGKGSEEIAAEAISAGVTDYLQKRGTEQYDRLATRIRNAVAQYRAERELQERVKELTTIRRISDLLSDDDGQVATQLQQVVDSLPQSLQYPERAVVRLVVGNAAFTSPAYERPTDSIDVYGVTVAGEELTLSVGYVSSSPIDTDDALFLPEERELFDTILQLVTAYLDRQHVLTDLREADRRLQLILENTTAVMYLKDTEGRYVFANAEYQQLFDLPSEEIVGRTDAELHPTTMSEPVGVNDRRVLETGEPIEVEERISVDDEERIYLSLKVPARNDAGEIEGVFGVSTEITERKAREQQLEALNRALPRLLSAETEQEVAELGVEAAREILDLQANAIHLYDADAGELAPVAHTDALVELVGELPTFTGCESIAWRVFQDGDISAIADVREDPDVYDSGTLIRSELYLPLGEYGILIAGSPTPATFDGQDVTVGELLATHIVTAFDQLSSEQQLRNREAELEERNERLEQFASMLSHDLRNPVSIATGNLDLYRETGDESKLEPMDTALTRIQELITDLTTLARHGTTEEEHELVSIPAVAREAWKLIDTRSATLTTEASTVTADESQLKALFENLFRNAVGHGGESVTVRVGPLEDGFYVEDTGEGIPPVEREAVFEHGYSTGYGGSGIGLTIVDRIAQGHGWDVALSESAEGGARFEFRDVGKDSSATDTEDGSSSVSEDDGSPASDDA